MKPLWEIYQVEATIDNSKMWVLDGPMVKTPQVFSTLAMMHSYMESFQQTPKERTTTKVRSGDASTPKHPYDRTDDYWETQHEKV